MTSHQPAANHSHPSLAHQEHRPWPAPQAPWIGRQSWLELLFAHWTVDAAVLRPLIPAGLELDLFDSQAWVGVVPLRMEGVTLRPLPALPWLSAFPELNVRTYVTRQGKPGVWFMSLDATNPLAVWAARRFVHLPYRRARMRVRRQGDSLHYESRRRSGGGTFQGSYRPTGPPCAAAPGTLDHWLTERYCLYAQRPDKRLTRVQVHHAPWPLQPAAAEIAENTMLAIHGLPVEDPPLLHYAERQDVVVWAPELL